VKKKQKWNQTGRQKKAFREKFTKELVLAILNLNKKIRIKIDMLDYIIHDSFQYLYSSAYLLFHTLDFFELYTNISNYLDIMIQ